MRQHGGAEKKPGSGFPSGSEDRSGFCWQHSCCSHQTTPLLCLHKRNVRCCLIVCITTPSCMCSISCFGHRLRQMKIKSKWRATKLTVFAQIQWSKIWWNCLFYFLIEKFKPPPRQLHASKSSTNQGKILDMCIHTTAQEHTGILTNNSETI